ncbi:MAG: hypothetical protein Q4A27_03305 [bacterium]|nr:hypothetical protein [bacterium]
MKKNIFLWGGSAILILSLALNGFLIWQNYNANKTNDVVKTGTVCGDEQISKINQALGNEEFKKEAYEEVSAAVSKLENYRKDANCTMIMLTANYLTGSIDSAKTEFENLKSLGEKGLYPSPKINFSAVYSELEKLLREGNFTQDEVEGVKG